MSAIAVVPLPALLVAICLAGFAIGSLVNWAIYRLAWNPLEISPWGPAPEQTPPRNRLDCIPVFGWWRLRREHAIHGRGFWVRPVLIELAMGLGLATLFWWEVSAERLIIPQVNDWLRMPVNLSGVVPCSWTISTFINHSVLIALMAAASFIDIDEKIIPDGITVPGTLLGLLLAIFLPLGLLPHVDIRESPELVSTSVSLPAVVELKPGLAMFTEPVTLASPNTWPEAASDWRYLLLGQACWWLWCLALCPRIWRGRHGVGRALSLIARRVGREMTRAPLGVIAWPGSLAVGAVWWWGGSAWVGLLTGLMGLAISGGMVWIVRIVGTAALRREAMGFGDVTLMMMVGTFVGWQAGVLIFFVAPFAGLFVGVAQLLARRDDEIPYGPFLCLGTLFVIVRWPDVWLKCQFAFQAGWLVPVVLLVCFALLGIMLAVWQQIKIRAFGLQQEDS